MASSSGVRACHQKGVDMLTECPGRSLHDSFLVQQRARTLNMRSADSFFFLHYFTEQQHTTALGVWCTNWDSFCHWGSLSWPLEEYGEGGGAWCVIRWAWWPSCCCTNMSIWMTAAWLPDVGRKQVFGNCVFLWGVYGWSWALGNTSISDVTWWNVMCIAHNLTQKYAELVYFSLWILNWSWRINVLPDSLKKDWLSIGKIFSLVDS